MLVPGSVDGPAYGGGVDGTDGIGDTALGACAELTRVVTDADTASALASGDLAVLGTPRLLAWCEEATCLAVAASLPVGATTVGTSVRLDHLAPSGVGEQVTVRAEVTAIHGRRVVLGVEATDAGGTVVGIGTVERVVVDAGRFLARLAGGPGQRPGQRPG